MIDIGVETTLKYMCNGYNNDKNKIFWKTFWKILKILKNSSLFILKCLFRVWLVGDNNHDTSNNCVSCKIPCEPLRKKL